MQQAERDLERTGHHRARDVATGLLPVEARLDDLQIPVSEIAPEEAVRRQGRVIEPVPLEGEGRLAHRFLAARDYPAVGEGELFASDHVRVGPGERPGLEIAGEVRENEP